MSSSETASGAEIHSFIDDGRLVIYDADATVLSSDTWVHTQEVR